MHADDEPCFAEELLSKLIPALIRSGSLDEEVVLDLADDCDSEARTTSAEREEQLSAIAMQLRLWALEAVGPTVSEARAKKRRGKLHAIDGDISSV